MNTLKLLYDVIKTDIQNMTDNGQPIFNFVIQYQGQDKLNRDFQPYSWPACFIQFETDAQVLVFRTDFIVKITFHIWQKAYTEEFIDVWEIGEKLLNVIHRNHYDNLTSPIMYLYSELDNMPQNQYRLKLCFETYITQRDEKPQYGTYSVDEFIVNSDYGTQSRTDLIIGQVVPGPTSSNINNYPIFYQQPLPPSNPFPGDRWLNTNDGIEYFWFTDNNSSQWLSAYVKNG